MSEVKYKKFIIEKYKAITKPITINVSEKGVYPMVGINESGKTTILHAIMAFDHYNDEFHANYRHLEGHNIYSEEKEAVVSAEIEITRSRLNHYFQELKKGIDDKGTKRTAQAKFNQSFEEAFLVVKIARIIGEDGKHKFYKLSSNSKEIVLVTSDWTSKLCENIVSELPYIVYFDDFTDKISGVVNLSEENSTEQEAYRTLNKIFKYGLREVRGDYELSKLMNEKEYIWQRDIDTVNKKLNKLVIDNWKAFKITKKMDEEILEIKISFRSPELKIQIVEYVSDRSNYFSVLERSKGFHWFLNFTLKTKFNPKGEGVPCMYLLDEPGSYLHPKAQQGLCEILKELGKDHVVIYNTHSHYMLDSEFLPKTKIPYKDKKDNNNIILCHFSEYSNGRNSRWALEPIQNALKLPKSLIEKDILASTIIIVEGIYDFYSFDIFVPYKEDDIGFMPCKGASTITNPLLFLVCAKKKGIICLLDKDKTGDKIRKDIERDYGKIVKTIQYNNRGDAVESLYDKSELKNFAKTDKAPDFKAIKSLIPDIYALGRDEARKRFPKTQKFFQQFYNEKIKVALNK